MKVHRRIGSFVSFASLALLTACGGNGSGTVKVTTWGEEFLEEGIPAESEDTDGFVDGWAVDFSKFVVSLGDIRLDGLSGEDAVTDATFRAFDLTKEGPFDVTEFDVASGRWTTFSWAIAPSSELTAGNAEEADVTRMRDENLSVLVVGEATRAGETITFEWPFSLATDYLNCDHPDFGEGVAVADGETATAQMTVHADHLFMDDLQAEEPSLRFDAIAEADANDDGEVTLEELDAVELADLPPGSYGTGAVAGVETLRDFIEVQVRSVGHFRGEGHCSPEIRD